MKAASRSFATGLRGPDASLLCLIANQWNGLALAVDARSRVCWVSGKCERWLGFESGRGLGEILWRELELPWISARRSAEPSPAVRPSFR